MKKLSLLLFAACISATQLFGQISEEIDPQSMSLNLSDNIATFQMPTQDNAALRAAYPDDGANEKLRFAEPLPTKISLLDEGTWTELANGDRICRLKILSPTALNLNFLYGEFWLPEGSTYHIYDQNYDEVLGAYTYRNNKADFKFATEVLHNDEVILEYYQPNGVDLSASIIVSQVGHGFRGLFLTEEDAELDPGDSGNCQVDVNCAEGNGWQDDKKAVARMTLNGSDWCTGALVQTVGGDCVPYFLSADHCMSSYDAVSSPSTSGFVFYFNYEYVNCQTAGAVPTQTTTGGILLANDSPSDFALIELAENPFDEGYDVYLAGWDARNQTPVSGGVGIHHPAGDVKKIATHTQVPASTDWAGGTPNTHWQVFWDPTANGHSVTEGGSSGSPIFDSNHRILGQLHGGSSLNCSDPANDVGEYGKLAYSWDNNGATSNERKLQPWLDEFNTGIQFTDGSYGGTCPVYVRFTSPEISVGEGTDCNNQTVIVSLGTTAPPTVSTVVSFSLSGSAVAGVDYIAPSNTQVTFPAGVLGSQDIVIPIIQDGLTESDRDITITLQSISGDPDLLLPANPVYTLEIKDDDPLPSPVSNADITVGQGSASSTAGPTPFYGYYEDKRLQMLFLASELQALGLSAGNLTEISFNVLSIASTQNYSNFNIAMGHTTIAGTTSSWSSNLSPVYNNASYDPFVGWNDFVLGTPFNWNGTDNLIVEVCFDNGSWTQSDGVATDTVPFSAIVYEFTDGGSGCSLGADQISASRAQTRFKGQAGTSVQSSVNSGAQVNIGANATVHFYDPVTNSILGTVRNLSNQSLGCCELKVNQAGTGGDNWVQGYLTSEKTFELTTSNSSSLPIEVDLYYTDDEVNNFPSTVMGVATCQSAFSPANLSSESSVNAYTESPFGVHSTFTFPTTTDKQFFALTDKEPGSLDCTTNQNPNPSSVNLAARVFLGGSYNQSTGLMHDLLRSGGHLPLTEPYSALANFTHVGSGGGETVAASVLASTGASAVVDWVFLELRNTNNFVVATRSALLLRDGSIVDVDGDPCSAVAFSAPSNASYHVVVRHRNHLGVMLDNPVLFSPSVITAVDLSEPTADVVANSTNVVNNKLVLWAGNGNGNNKVVYQGSGSDILPVTSVVFSDPSNVNYQYTWQTLGYHTADYNMDGKVTYQGFSSDIVPITQTIFGDPTNVFFELTHEVVEQIP